MALFEDSNQIDMVIPPALLPIKEQLDVAANEFWRKEWEDFNNFVAEE